MHHNTFRSAIATLVAAFVFAVLPRATAQTEPSATPRAQPPRSLRLYVFDCGTLNIADMSRFSLKPEEVAASDLSVACFFVTHPKGTLIWDTGAVPDSAWKPTGTGPWENSGPSYRLSEILAGKGIHHHLDNWGPQGGHDWPYWKHQMREYIPRLP
jgi:hypothetical protein